MAVMYARTRLAVAFGAAVLLSACTVHKTEVPSLSGPSGLGTGISIAISPDVLPQDGLSQSLVTITAINNVGQPAANVQMRADIAVGGVLSDFGRLSAKSLVTDSNGHATTVYTAPAPVLGFVTSQKVDIEVDADRQQLRQQQSARGEPQRSCSPGVVTTSSALVPRSSCPAVAERRRCGHIDRDGHGSVAIRPGASSVCVGFWRRNDRLGPDGHAHVPQYGVMASSG